MEDFVCYCRATYVQFVQDVTPNVLHIRHTASWRLILLVSSCV